jgi:very-short-patch-repair endonuclease
LKEDLGGCTIGITMKRNQVLPYDPALCGVARELRKNGTLGEVLLWRELRAKQLNCEFHRQVPTGHYIVDFYCHELKLAIEVDGSSHHHEDAFQRDAERQRELEQVGVTVLRFTEWDVRRQIGGVVEAIADHVAQCTRKDISAERD